MPSTQETKKVSINFNFMSVERTKKAADSSAYDINAVVTTLCGMFESLSKKLLIERKYDFVSKEKTVWLDEYKNLNDGNFDLVFKSARYNQSRNVIDTQTMEEVDSKKKEPQEGDEYKTHLCIRRASHEERFITIVEQNNDGLFLSEIKWYLNQKLESYHAENGGNYSYSVDFAIIPGKDFLTELRELKKINLLTLTVEKTDPAFGDFYISAERATTLRDTVEIRLHKKRGKSNEFPIDMVEEYFKNTGAFKRIKKIVVEGSNESRSLKIDTDSIQLKHIITVSITAFNEVDSNDFFYQTQNIVKQVGG